MTRELLIMRHAKSDWSSPASSDFERRLNKRGTEAAPRMGSWLRNHGLLPDHVVASPATRAKQTVKLVTTELAFDSVAVVWEPRIYEATLGTLLQVMSDCPGDRQRVLLVGHNPGFERLLTYLCDSIPQPEDANLMPTATVAHIELPNDWRELQQACGRLQILMRPKQLPTTE